MSKTRLTEIIRHYYPNTNDVQQARHLGAQKGWWIIAGGRDNIVRDLKKGEYQLHSLEKPYPGFKQERRQMDKYKFAEIKALYGYRCATCGSLEGEPHFHWPQTKTILQIAHMDPRKDLSAGNMIPQCQKCNRADRNYWVYDKKGRVVKIANAAVIEKMDEDICKEIYLRLKKRYDN